LNWKKFYSFKKNYLTIFFFALFCKAIMKTIAIQSKGGLLSAMVLSLSCFNAFASSDASEDASEDEASGGGYSRFPTLGKRRVMLNLGGGQYFYREGEDNVTPEQRAAEEEASQRAFRSWEKAPIKKKNPWTTTFRKGIPQDLGSNYRKE
jgi:hypothetical protein